MAKHDDCPVCRSTIPDVNKSRDYLDERTVAEDRESCPVCNMYWRDYSYGYTQIQIGFVDFAYTYNETYQEEQIRRVEMEKVLAEASEFWVKHNLEIRAFQKGLKETPIMWAALSDWLEEHGYMLNAAGAKYNLPPS